MSATVRHLHISDAESGELLDGCPVCSEKDDVINGLQRDVRGWAARYADLKRDKEREARKDPLWPAAVRVFEYWQQVCRHPKSEWTVERFELAAPLLKKYGEEMCLRAIAGIAFDPFVTVRKNGTRKRHDGWHLIFKGADKFEEYCNRAPVDWRPPPREEETGPPAGGTVPNGRPGPTQVPDTSQTATPTLDV